VSTGIPHILCIGKAKSNVTVHYSVFVFKPTTILEAENMVKDP